MSGSGRLECKTALVTGAAGAIGKAVVQRFAEEGAEVVAVDREAGSIAGAATTRQLDLRDPGACRGAVVEAKARSGRLDVVVNCAAVLLPGDGAPAEVSLTTWEQTLHVNLTAMWQVCTAALEEMRGPTGAIVNVASIVALRGSVVPQVAYTASKGGLIALTRELAVANASRGIRINAVCPGPLREGLMSGALDTEEALARRLAHVPMGRLGAPREVAEVCLFLASEEAAYVTGVALPVDGGATAAFIAS